MRSLFWKGMLAFLAVILVAVATEALLVGRVTTTAFRRYALTHSGIWDQAVERLATYYTVRGSWAGIQNVLLALPGMEPSRGRDGRGGKPLRIDFRLADSRGRLVGDTRGPPVGVVSQAKLKNSISIEVDGRIVGYLLPAPRNLTAVPLAPSQDAFLARVSATLWIATLTALAAALVIGGLLFNSIVAPLRRLTIASQSIAEGDLSARAPVRGQDEVAQLAASFNQMAESLAQAEEARQNQTADIAHELRTPLTVLQGTLEAMLDGVYSTDRENLRAALAQTRTIYRLVDDLRLLALADAGQLRLRKIPLDLGAFLREVVEAHQPRAQERKLALVLEAPSALPTVPADRERLAQVMGNLLSNALRYVPRGGRITVQVMDQGEAVIVAVADDGPGAPAEDLPRLFERFWRGDPARRRATGGSGLGLSIARHIVEAHGGRIWAEATVRQSAHDKATGGGLTITFSLPVTRGAKA